MNTWWNTKNDRSAEIDENPLKPDKCMKKAQRSQYWQNNEIAVTPNDQKLIITSKSLRSWPSKSQYILNILMTQQNWWMEGKQQVSKLI